MSARTSSRPKIARSQNRDDSASDAELDRFLADHRDAVEAKLQEARRSIARGRAKPLEPLPTLLRDARRRAKMTR